jgi:hypothetical protein
MTYNVTFTPLAAAFAEKAGGLPALEERVRGEIAEFTLTHPYKAGDALLHVLNYTGEEQLFVITGIEDGLLVDTGHYEAGPILDAGPFKGKQMMFPRGDSDDYEPAPPALEGDET